MFISIRAILKVLPLILCLALSCDRAESRNEVQNRQEGKWLICAFADVRGSEVRARYLIVCEGVPLDSYTTDSGTDTTGPWKAIVVPGKPSMKCRPGLKAFWRLGDTAATQTQPIAPKDIELIESAEVWQKRPVPDLVEAFFAQNPSVPARAP